MGVHTATFTCKEHIGQHSLGHTDELSPQLADYFRVGYRSETSFDLVLSNNKLREIAFLPQNAILSSCALLQLRQR